MWKPRWNRRRIPKWNWRLTEGDTPPPLCFWAQSAEAHENNEVEFLVRAEKCKRVRKNMKTKDEWLFGRAQKFGSS